MSGALVPPLKWHGGKHYLAERIVALMPPRCKNPNAPAADDPGWLHYVEPFAGGLSVLLALDPEGISEVANDLDAHLTNFWNVLACESQFAAFRRLCETTPFSEWEWSNAERKPEYGCGSGDRVTRARAFFVLCRQSLAGRMKSFAPLSRARTRRGISEQASAWLTAVEGLPAVHERLKRVVILSGKAADVIREQDGPRTLFYLDPPYLHETRATTADYAHEMTETDHLDLLKLLGRIQGRFLLSGYRNPMYDGDAERFGWQRHDFELPNHAAGGDTKRRMVESVWKNW